MDAVHCNSRPGHGDNRWGQPMLRERHDQDEPRKKKPVTVRKRWAEVQRGEIVVFGGYYAMFIGWPGPGSTPWVHVFSQSPTARPTESDRDTFERLCTAFDRTRSPRCREATGQTNPH